MLVNESFQTPTPSTRRVGVYMVEHRPVGRANAVGLRQLLVERGGRVVVGARLATRGHSVTG